MDAMIFAAGLGTRLKPLTNYLPKALVQINGMTLLEHNVKKMCSYGIKRIIVNVHHFPDMIIQHIDYLSKKYDCKIDISDERDELLDTGGGLLKAVKNFFNIPEIKCDFAELKCNINQIKCDINSLKCDINSAERNKHALLLHNVDILSDIDFTAMEKEFYNSDATALLAVKKRESSRYLIFNEEKRLSGWENTSLNKKIITVTSKEENRFAFSGVHIIDINLLQQVKQRGKFSVTDMYLSLSADNVIKPYIRDGLWIDAGRTEDLKKAEELF